MNLANITSNTAEIHAVDVSVATSIIENLTTAAIANEEVCEVIFWMTVEDNIISFIVLSYTHNLGEGELPGEY